MICEPLNGPGIEKTAWPLSTLDADTDFIAFVADCRTLFGPNVRLTHLSLNRIPGAHLGHTVEEWARDAGQWIEPYGPAQWGRGN